MNPINKTEIKLHLLSLAASLSKSKETEDITEIYLTLKELIDNE